MTIKTEGNTHINHQLSLSTKNDFINKRNKRFNFSKHEFNEFSSRTQEYLDKTNTRIARHDVIKWIKSEKPIAAITMVFNCAINHDQSIDLLNRFYGCLCKYQFGRTYKKRNEFISMFAFLENAVKDKNKQTSLKHEDSNHFHLILCDDNAIFDDTSSIVIDIESARCQANSDFKKAMLADNTDKCFVPQITRCKVQEYFNHGDDGLENYVTKNLENHARNNDLKFDQIAYPSIEGFTFGERVYN
ncbi:hypothetical protein [Arenicella xantha]|uniref:Uncharacterized protein n=1 Tax=Arenicella xantha TaxID=644221 RepID=A0A395JRB1_9GAMM|nr:hypothetical protein [Arenicella xantha]RBP52996.1 hypothetical protein DFR28_101380 [Arenicella xantha]